MIANGAIADATPPSISSRVMISAVGCCSSSGSAPVCSVSGASTPARRAIAARCAASPPTTSTTSSSPARIAAYAWSSSVCCGMPVCTSTVRASGASDAIGDDAAGVGVAATTRAAPRCARSPRAARAEPLSSPARLRGRHHELDGLVAAARLVDALGAHADADDDRRARVERGAAGRGHRAGSGRRRRAIPEPAILYSLGKGARMPNPRRRPTRPTETRRSPARASASAGPIVDSDQHLYEYRGMWREHIDPALRDDALELDRRRARQHLAHAGATACSASADVQDPGRDRRDRRAAPPRARGAAAAAPLRRRAAARLLGAARARREARRARRRRGGPVPELRPRLGAHARRVVAPALLANLRAWNRWCASGRRGGRGRLHPVAAPPPRAISTGWRASSRPRRARACASR